MELSSKRAFVTAARNTLDRTRHVRDSFFDPCASSAMLADPLAAEAHRWWCMQRVPVAVKDVPPAPEREAVFFMRGLAQDGLRKLAKAGAQPAAAPAPTCGPNELNGRVAPPASGVARPCQAAVRMKKKQKPRTRMLTKTLLVLKQKREFDEFMTRTLQSAHDKAFYESAHLLPAEIACAPEADGSRTPSALAALALRAQCTAAPLLWECERPLLEPLRQ